jgi:hypothetical protein
MTTKLMAKLAAQAIVEACERRLHDKAWWGLHGMGWCGVNGTSTSKTTYCKLYGKRCLHPPSSLCPDFGPDIKGPAPKFLTSLDYFLQASLWSIKLSVFPFPSMQGQWPSRFINHE